MINDPPAFTPGASLEARVIPRLTRRLVPFLFLLYIVAYLDRINVGFAALQMQDQLGFSDRVYGAGAGIFFFGYLLFQVPSNLLLQRVGARRWIAVLMVTWGIISSCMMLVRTPRDFYALRFLLGVAEAGFFPGIILYLRNWFPAEARARTVAWFMTAVALSGVVGGPISGALLGLHHRGLAGWQWMFLMEGLPAIVLGIVVVFSLTDRPEDAAWLPAEERDWLIAMLAREGQPGSAVAANLPAAFLNLNVWLLTLVYFGLNTCSYGISLWLPKLIKSLSGFSNFQIGLLTAIPYLLAAISMVLVGFHSDRSGERRWHTAAPALLAAAALVAAAYSNSALPMIAAISVAVLAQHSMFGPFWALPTSFLRGTAAAAGIALINSIGNLGGFFGSSIIGIMKSSTGEFRGGLLVVAAAIGTAGVLALLVRPRKSDSSNTPAT
ncbi:MAG TPA: MFS transporter [Terriglobales bacterium]|jgi:ACS family tartrate transporter-like MFS transporter